RSARHPHRCRRGHDPLCLPGNNTRGASPRRMIIPAPFERYEGEVVPEWIDANNHMNLAYYVVLFDYATDALFDAIDIGRQYKDETNYGTFAVETHTLYERELLVG